MILRHLNIFAGILLIFAGEQVLAQAGDSKTDPETDALARAEQLAKLQKAVAEAEEAAAKAKTAQLQAEQSAARQEFGNLQAPTLPDGKISLATTAQGKAEASLLYARSLQAIGPRLSGKICDAGKTFILSGSSGVIDLGELAGYRLNRMAALVAIDDAQARVDDALQRASEVRDTGANGDGDNARNAIGTGLVAADSLLAGVAKLGSYFRTS
ncbi:MAG: hypothetical protein Q8R44_07610 [Novosphingobium sp.]|nr:hypothetical protein [Novosphingobium sp.]